MKKLLLAASLSLGLGAAASAAEFTWEFPAAPAAPKAEICTFMYGKTWAYSFEMDDNPAGAFTIAKPLFDQCKATDAPVGVKGGREISLPCTLALFAVALDNGNGSNLSLEQLRQVREEGWGFANHGYWSTGIHWDKALANDEAMYRREFFWGQFFLSLYLWDGKRAPTAMVFPNGDPGYKPFLKEYGILVGTRYADSPHNVLNAGATPKVNWEDCGRLMLDAGHWEAEGKLEPLWKLPKSFREGDWLIDFTHGISEKGKGNHDAASKRLAHIRRTWGVDGADDVWLTTSDRVAQYRLAAEAAKVTTAKDRVTVTLPDTVCRSPLTLKISGIPAGAKLAAPQGGVLYRDAQGDVFLTTPVIGDHITQHPAKGLKNVHAADLKAGKAEPREIAFPKPVNFAALRLRQMGNLPDGFKLDLRMVTPEGKEIPFNMGKYEKWVQLNNAWGNWRLFPQLPDEKPVLVKALRFNAAPCFNRVEVWAVE